MEILDYVSCLSQPQVSKETLEENKVLFERMREFIRSQPPVHIYTVQHIEKEKRNAISNQPMDLHIQ